MPSVPHELHDEIRREHEELRELLGSVHLLLAARVASVADVRARLASLGEHIETHFHEEENEGVFAQIVDLAPRLNQRVKLLCEEHAQLRTEVVKLVELANDDDSQDAWWGRLEEAFREFSKTLMQHESKENQLLQEAYGEDIGLQD